MPDLDAFQELIRYRFRDPALLRLSLTHPSLAHEQGSAVAHNQRLEFLGDAVLGMVLTRELFDRFPDVDEGPLTKARAHLVNRRALAQQGRQLKIGARLILSRGEEANGGRERGSAVADAYEALIGAIFLDGGYEAAREFILRCFQPTLARSGVIPNVHNPKGELQEMLQVNAEHAPLYEVAAETGPDHNREFECVVRHGGVELGRGRGRSKKNAETEAAQAALRTLRNKTGPVT